MPEVYTKLEDNVYFDGLEMTAFMDIEIESAWVV